MISKNYKTALRCALTIGRKIGSWKVVDSPDSIEKYSHDESEEKPVLPAAVVFPETVSDVVDIMRIAGKEGVFITPRGGGTGRSGGAVPVKGGLVVSFERMNQIEEISNYDMIAVCRPGVILKNLHDSVEERRLFYPPDPASLENCTIGGNIAENAGGPRAFKYGTTRNYVLSLEMVTTGGQVIKTGGRSVKQAQGPCITSLMVGSEGTLAVITLAILHLISLPEAVATCMISFSSMDAAAGAVVRVLESGIMPRVVDIMDRECMNLMTEFGNVHFEEGQNSVLLVEIDGNYNSVNSDLEKLGGIMEKAGALNIFVLSGIVEKNRFWSARRALSEDMRKKYALKFSDDISVPLSKLVFAVSRIYRIAEKNGLICAVFGHAGDGNLHINLLGQDAENRGAIVKARDEILKLVISVDGSVSGEHGIGSLKKEYLRMQQGKNLVKLQKEIKKIFNPSGLLNPGKIY